MKTTPLARLLALAVASHQSGNTEDSHDIFAMFLSEIDKQQETDTASLISDLGRVVTAALVDEEPEEIASADAEETGEPAKIDTATHRQFEEDDDDAAADSLEQASLFDRQAQDFTLDDFESLAAADEDDGSDEDFAAANLAALSKPRTAA